MNRNTISYTFGILEVNKYKHNKRLSYEDMITLTQQAMYANAQPCLLRKPHWGGGGKKKRKIEGGVAQKFFPLYQFLLQIILPTNTVSIVLV